ncbi:MAG: hypothetical protein U0640_05070 [Phycisphaerales bacterium]
MDFLRRLRTFHEGVLAFGETLGDVTEPCKFVLDPLSGEPTLPVAAEAIRSQDVMLFAPDDSLDNPECLQVFATCTEINPNTHEAADRWLAYHLKPTHARWAKLNIQSVKRLDEVIDGDLVRLANPLRQHEGALCKFANQHQAALANACERQLHTRPENPFAVGVDPWGLDLRARFGVLRLEFETPVSTPEEARTAISRTLQLAQ